MSSPVLLKDVMSTMDGIAECDAMLATLDLNERQISGSMKRCLVCAVKQRRANLVDRIDGRVLKVEA